jgi:hypothetical protein
MDGVPPVDRKLRIRVAHLSPSRRVSESQGRKAVHPKPRRPNLRCSLGSAESAVLYQPGLQAVRPRPR